MISLRIKVPTKYRLLPNARIRREIPENWQEVSPRQLLGYCKALRLADSQNPQSAAQVRILAARYMLRLPWWLFYIVNRYQLAEVTRELHWLNTEPLTHNKFPKIKKFFGPADSFGNLRFAEFAVASAYYQAFVRTNNPDTLHYLLAVLYRPADKQKKRTDPDRRTAFEQHLLTARVRHVRKMSVDKKQAIVLYFAGCMAELSMRYPLLFSGGDEAGGPGSATGSADWLEFMRHLPSDKFGSLDKIENSLIHPVFEIANRMMADAKKEKARRKRSMNNE